MNNMSKKMGVSRCHKIFDGYLNVDNSKYFSEDGRYRTKDKAYVDEKGIIYIGEREIINPTWKTI